MRVAITLIVMLNACGVASAQWEPPFEIDQGMGGPGDYQFNRDRFIGGAPPDYWAALAEQEARRREEQAWQRFEQRFPRVPGGQVVASIFVLNMDARGHEFAYQLIHPNDRPRTHTAIGRIGLELINPRRTHRGRLPFGRGLYLKTPELPAGQGIPVMDLAIGSDRKQVPFRDHDRYGGTFAGCCLIRDGRIHVTGVDVHTAILQMPGILRVMHPSTRASLGL